MPLSALARRKLAVGLLSQSRADDFADVVDAGSGTLEAATVSRLITGIGNRKIATGIKTAVNAGTALSGAQQRHLALLVGDPGVAQEIATALDDE